MNPQFPNNRPILPNNPFYNPHKDINTNNQQFLYQNIQPPPFIPNNNNSKGYIARSNIIEGKVGNSSSNNYLKNNNEMQLPANKINNNSMTSPTHHNNNFPSFPHFNKSMNDMVKSNIQ